MEVLDIINKDLSYSSTKQKLENLGLIIKEYPELDLYLIKYDKNKSDMSNSDVKKCRGLVAKMSDNSLVCFPPPKSCELDEIYNSIEQWNTLSVENFIDGTMINLFNINNQWLISTRSNIGANCRWMSKKNFSTMFYEACNINMNDLDKTKFYTFVLMHPENIIVTKYCIPEIVLVSMGTVEDGLYKNINIYEQTLNIKKPLQFPLFNNMSEIKNYVNKMDYEQQGLVIKNKTNMRYKIRNPNYNYVKSLKGNTNNSKYLYHENKKKKTIKEYLAFFPEETELYNKFHNEFIKLIRDTHNYYKLYHIRKTIQINQMPFQLRPICFELHKIFKNKRTIITFDVVYNYINNLESAQIVFILKPNKDCDLCYNIKN